MTNAPDKSEMKACPFCGGVAMTRFESMEQVWSALCQSCEAALLYVAYSEAAAIAAWNTRASSRPPADQVPDMVEAAMIEAGIYERHLTDDDREAVRRAILAALQAVPAASEVGEDDEEEPLYFCEQCHAPLYADDEYAVDEYSVAGCWHAMTDDPSIAGRPCYAERVGKPSAALKASKGTGE